MRTLLCGMLVVLLCVPVQAAEKQVAVYDQDPEHLWNRLYRAVAVLDEFLSTHGRDRASGDLKRALLLHDVWAAFDLTDRSERHVLWRQLASGQIIFPTLKKKGRANSSPIQGRAG